MKQITVGIAVDSFLPRWDGVSRALVELIPRLTENFRFKLMVPDYKGERPDFNGVEYALFPMIPGIRLEGAGIPIPSTASMRRAFEQVDLLWTHSVGSLGGKALRIAHEKSIPVLSMIHSIEWEIYAQNLPFGRRLFREFWLRECRRRYSVATRILTPSQATADALKAHGFSPPINVTPLGVDTERFSPLGKEARAKRKEELGIPEGRFVFGYLGRFGAEKNLELLVDAFTSLNHPTAHLLLIGGDPNAIKRSTEHPAISALGSTTTPEYFYQAMDAYVLPSRSESAPLAILEAMSTGAIPLSTPVGNVPTYLRPEIGYLFEQGSKGELIAQMQTLLACSNAHDAMRSAARKTVIEAFDWAKSAQALKIIFEETLGHSNR